VEACPTALQEGATQTLEARQFFTSEGDGGRNS
jgi:hypothetical protein